MDLVFRIRNDSDVKKIAELTESRGIFSPDEVRIARELASDNLHHENSDYAFINAFIGDELISFLCYGKIPGTDHCFELYWVVTKHGINGTAKLLFGILEERLKSQKVRKLYVDTEDSQMYQQAIKFYKSMGLKEEAILKDFYRAGVHKIILVKEY